VIAICRTALLICPCIAAEAQQCRRLTTPLSQPAESFREFRGLWIVNSHEYTFVSSDRGATWRKVLDSVDQALPQPLPRSGRLLGPFDGRLFVEPYLAPPDQGNYVLRTSNGVDWSRVQIPLSASNADFVAVGDFWLVASTAAGADAVYISRDGGSTWSLGPAASPSFRAQFSGGARFFRTRNRILRLDALTSGNHTFSRLLRLSLSGDRWEDITPCGCALHAPSYLEADYQQALVMTGSSAAGTAGTFPGSVGVLITADGGSTWVVRENLGYMTIQDDVIVAGLLGLFSVRYLFSSDFGASWKSLGDGFPYFQPGGRPPDIRFLGKTEDLLLFSNGRELYGCALR
jgi:photosystem II stability/assembly factor-like uncharacterized protein